jgi:hypothetical protein
MLNHYDRRTLLGPTCEHAPHKSLISSSVCDSDRSRSLLLLMRPADGGPPPPLSGDPHEITRV